MATHESTAQQPRAVRAPLNRTHVLEAGLRFVDAHGLDALSMRKLGAELGVEGMALYNHVENKDGLLDGIVGLLWDEVESALDAAPSWRDSIRSLARSLRRVIHRHRQAAQLLCCYPMSAPALRLFDTQVRTLQASGFSEKRASEAVCTVMSFAFGYASGEVGWFGPLRTVAESESEAQFESGLELVVRGLETLIGND